MKTNDEDKTKMSPKDLWDKIKDKTPGEIEEFLNGYDPNLLFKLEQSVLYKIDAATDHAGLAQLLAAQAALTGSFNPIANMYWNLVEEKPDLIDEAAPEDKMLFYNSRATLNKKGTFTFHFKKDQLPKEVLAAVEKKSGLLDGKEITWDSKCLTLLKADGTHWKLVNSATVGKRKKYCQVTEYLKTTGFGHENDNKENDNKENDNKDNRNKENDH